MVSRVPDRFSVKARGVTFHPGYPANLLALRDLWAGRQGEASLVREPDNPHDAGAVAVLVAGEVVGHLPRDLAGRVSAEIEAGRQWSVHATVLIEPDHPHRPGLLLECTDARVMEEWRTFAAERAGYE